MNKIHVYVAGSSREMDRVDRALANLALVDNIEITYRWIDDMRRDIAAGKPGDIALSRSEAAAARRLCLNKGVGDADFLWLLYPIEPTRGAWVELGYALARLEVAELWGIIISHEKVLREDPTDPTAGACIMTRSDNEPDILELRGDLAAFHVLRDVAKDSAAWTKVLNGRP